MFSNDIVISEFYLFNVHVLNIFNYRVQPSTMVSAVQLLLKTIKKALAAIVFENKANLMTVR